MFFDWTRIDFFWKFKVFKVKVDLDVVRFVCELTKNKSLYRDNVVRRWLFILDRIIDMSSIVTLTYFITELTWHWYVYLSVVFYIIFRVISLVLYFYTLTKCSAILSLCAVLAPCILN